MNLKSYRQIAKSRYPSVTDVDVDRILAQVTRLPRLELAVHPGRELTDDECLAIDAFLERRLAMEPLQYIFGEAHFRDFVLKVGKGVLIPRPETEMMVDLAINKLPQNAAVCDLGTGSGAIAIAIAVERPDCKIVALDCSDAAISYAEENIERYQLANVSLCKSDLLTAIKGQKFHLITANLPYVSRKFYDELHCEVRNFEPEMALLAGEDGLDLIRKTAAAAPSFLFNSGKIIFEFSPEQKEAVAALLRENKFVDVAIIDDLTGRARFAVAVL